MSAASDEPSQVARQSRCLELVISLSIVFLLLALLLPVIGPTHRRLHRVAEVRMDISTLEDAITKFKVTYGVEPPSGIVLHANQAGWDRDRQSKGLIRQLWPKFDFATCGGLKNVPPDGITLNGAECLVFFLGGLPRPDSGERNGFAKNPTRPFSATETSREGPFFEFKGGY